MSGTKNHDYHILPPDIWPFLGALSALTLTSGGVLTMHSDVFGSAGKYVILLGAIGVDLAAAKAQLFAF